MNELVSVKNGVATTTTKLVADKFNKQHRLILDSAKRIMKEHPEFGRANFSASSYTSDQNKVLDCFDITKDGYMMVAMSLTGADAMKWKVDFINAFNKMLKKLDDGYSVMDKCNDIIKDLECDKGLASIHGKGLANWKKQKKDHMQKVLELKDESQMLLGFEG